MKALRKGYRDTRILWLMMACAYLFLAGCGGGGGGGDSGGGGAVVPTVSKYTYSTKVYIVEKGSNKVRVINAPSDEELAKIPVGAAPAAIAVDNSVNKAYVANGGEKTISVIDTITHKVVSTLTTADKPVDVVMDPGAHRLYASLANNAVQVFNTDTQAAVTSVSVDAGPLRMAIDTAAQRLYVLGNFSVKVINTSSNTVSATLNSSAAANNPYSSLGLNPRLKRLYVINLLNANLDIFDTGSNTKISSAFASIFFPSDIFVNPNDDRVYVSSSRDTHVSALDANGTVLTYIFASNAERIVVNTLSNYLYAVDSSNNALRINRLDGLVPDASGTVATTTAYSKNYSLATTPSALAVVKPSRPAVTNMPALPAAGGYADSWKLLTANFNSVAYGNGLYVAVGDRGVIQTSPDGAAWTQRVSGVETTGGEFNLNRVIFAGGRFVAVGEGARILTSTNGVAWTTASGSGSGNLYGVAWNGTQYLAVGPDNAVSSPDGVTWTRSHAFDMTPGVTYLLDPVGYQNKFVISAQNIYNFVSDGNAVSKLMTAGGESFITNLGGGQNLINKPGTSTFVSVVSGSMLKSNSSQYTNNGLPSPTPLSSVVTISEDGGITKYVPPEMALTDGNEWNMVTYNPVKNLYVAVGGAGGSRSAYIYQADKQYKIPAANGIIATSSDGKNWTRRTNPLPQALFGVNVNTSTGEMIAVGEMGAILTSTDGAAWTVRAGNSTALPVTANALTAFTEVIWGGPGAGMFVAIGNAGTLYTSVNGSNWTKVAVTTTNDFTGITWGGLPGQQKFVASLRGTASSDWAYTSSDGVTWTPVARPAAASGGSDGLGMFGVVWNGSKFVGADLYDLYDSVDGVNWRFMAQSITFIPGGTQHAGVRLRYDAQARKFIFLRYSTHCATMGQCDRYTDILTSGDAVSWSEFGTGQVGTDFRNDALFDFSGEPLLTSGMVVYGLTAWVPYEGEMVLPEAGPAAMPVKTAMRTGANHCVYYKLDPDSRHDCPYYKGVYTNRMINTGSLMVGVGPGGIYTKSKIGINWNRMPSPGATFTSVAWNGSVFVAVGSHNIAVSR
ncbi:MAG: YncE family protein [Fluviicoccus sp.]|nr:YncE family protein [Fluviicoccus sp.]MDO8331071.1 YncE family protein [Fluviicoccus sp.]